MDLLQTLQILFLIGRIIVGGYFLMAGYHHFKDVKMMAGYAASKGTPAAEAAIIGTGILLVLGGASFLLGYHPTIGTALLIIFLLGVSAKIHNFWTIADPQARMNEQAHFGKNIVMIGFLLMTLMIFRPWPYSLGSLAARP
jgi:putative oxidoreductase